MPQRVLIDDIPAIWQTPDSPPPHPLVIWLPGFSGTKEGTQDQLDALTRAGYLALSFDPWQHGERLVETRDELRARILSNIRRWFWPILARTAEDVPKVVDWALAELPVTGRIGMGGISMGGDISIAAAGVEPRLTAVVGCIATPDWLRPGSFEPPGEPDAAAQADYDRVNPLTHLDRYAHCPAISFQSGAVDTQVPPDGGQRFFAALTPRYGDRAERLQVVLHPETPHRFTPGMLANAIAWYDRWLKN